MAWTRGTPCATGWGVGAFGRMLNAQLPVEARVLDVGCGTGQLTNFLGLRYGRTVIGGDLCLAPLRVAQDFRERFSINNAHFVQLKPVPTAVRARSV